MIEVLGLIGLAAALYGFFCLVGAAVATLVLPAGHETRLAWSLPLGIAAVVAPLASLAVVVPAGTAGPVLLVVAALAAGAVLLAVRRRLTRAGLRELAWSAAAGGPAMLVVLIPFVVRGGAGPLDMSAHDSWFWYIPMAHFLQDHTTGQALAAGAWPPTEQVSSLLPIGVRVGFDALDAGVASLLGVTPDRTLVPLLIVVLGACGASAYAVALEALRGRRAWAMLAAFVLAISPLVLPFLESSGPSLVAYCLLPAATWLAWRAVAEASVRFAAASGLLTSALVVAYTEVLPAYLLQMAMIVGAAGLLALLTGRPRWPALGRVARSVAVIAVVAVACSPLAMGRAYDYVDYTRSRASQGQILGPDWGLRLDSYGPLALGSETLFEIRRFPFLSDTKVVLAYVLAGLVAAVALAGMAAVRRGTAVWLISGVAATALVVLWASAGQGCNYCTYRATAPLYPYLAVAVTACGLGGWTLGRRLQQARGSRAGRLGRAAGVVPVVAVMLIFGRTTVSLLRAATDVVPTFTDAADRRVTSAVEDAGDRRDVLVEGVDTAYPITGYYWMSAVLQLVADAGRKPVFAAEAGQWVQGSGYPRGTEPPFPDSYGTVVTRFGGVGSRRVTVADAGRFVVQRRAPVDVSIQILNIWSVDERDDGASALPWARGPFLLQVSAPSRMERTVVFTLVGPAAGLAPVTATVRGKPVPVRRGARTRGSATWCVPAALAPGPTPVVVTPAPAITAAIPPPPQLHPDQVIPVMPRELGIATAYAAATCPVGPDPLLPSAYAASARAGG